MCKIRRVTIPILVGRAIQLDNSLGGSPTMLNLPLDDLRAAWIVGVTDYNGKQMKRTRIKIDDNIYIATIPPDKVLELMELGDNKQKVGFKNK